MCGTLCYKPGVYLQCFLPSLGATARQCVHRAQKCISFRRNAIQDVGLPSLAQHSAADHFIQQATGRFPVPMIDKVGVGVGSHLARPGWKCGLLDVLLWFMKNSSRIHCTSWTSMRPSINHSMEATLATWKQMMLAAVKVWSIRW